MQITSRLPTVATGLCCWLLVSLAAADEPPANPAAAPQEAAAAGAEGGPVVTPAQYVDAVSDRVAAASIGRSCRT